MENITDIDLIRQKDNVFYDTNSAERVGRRIRAIRTEKGMSQAELGAAMGLTADRIQKYENGARKPKIELLRKFAQVLGVEIIALMDPVISKHIGSMYAFFEMEDLYELDIKCEGPRYSLQFGDGITGTMNEYLKEWYEERESIKSRTEKATDEEQEIILKEYHNWKRTFPRSICDKTDKTLKKKRLQKTIESLQRQLDKLDE